MDHLKAALFALGVIGGIITPLAMARAQPSIELGPGGLRVDPGGGVDRDDARRIARREGIIDINSMERRGDGWVVYGEDRRGDEMRVRIDGRGRVISVR